MSAPATAPVLALVPPDDPAPPAGHAQPGALDRAVLHRKVRRVCTVACAIAAFAPVALTAVGPYVDDVVVAGMVFCWALVIPGCGFALLLTAAIGRTRDDLRAVLAAFLSLVLGIALVQPAGRAAMEAWASSHAAELDKLAAEWAMLGRTGAARDADGNTSSAASENAAALRRMGLYYLQDVNGGILFRTDAPFAPDLLYADPGVRAENECLRLRVTPVGGRWFLYECSDPREYQD